MKKYKIADIILEMNPKTDPFGIQSVPYEYSGNEEPVFPVEITDDQIIKALEKYPSLSKENAEYLLSGNVFYTVLIAFKGMMLHASAVMLDNEAYLFSAPSGTGKSTHTSLWLKEFKNARILNDDKPAIKIENGIPFVYGTPWSGKTNLNINTKVPLKGICFLSRGEKNEIRRASIDEAISNLLDQTVRPPLTQAMDSMLNTIEEIVNTAGIYMMKCNMEPEAAQISYKAMSGKEKI